MRAAHLHIDRIEVTVNGVAPAVAADAISGLGGDLDAALKKTMAGSAVETVRSRPGDSGELRRAIAGQIASAVAAHGKGQGTP
jgi:hypothetical protein